MFVAGSSRKNPDGTNAGFAVVTETEVLLKQPLLKKFSAQAAELVALSETCKLGNGKVVNNYTDSQYAFSNVHVFAQQWKNRGNSPPIRRRDRGRDTCRLCGRRGHWARDCRSKSKIEEEFGSQL